MSYKYYVGKVIFNFILHLNRCLNEMKNIGIFMETKYLLINV